jgi:hypothetical protein
MNTTTLTSTRFATPDDAFKAIEEAGLNKTAFKCTPDQGEYILIELPKKESAAKPEKAAKADKPARKGKAAAKPAKPAGKRGLAARMEKQKAEEKAKANQPKPAPKPQAAPGSKDQNYSIETMPSAKQIEGADGGWINRPSLAERLDFQKALKGELPTELPFALNRKDPATGEMAPALTHAPFIKSRDALYALRDKGAKDSKHAAEALKELLSWKEGKGTRMNCSSTIPLGRLHQKLILAFSARIEASKARAAKRSAKTNGAPKDAEQPTA